MSFWDRLVGWRWNPKTEEWRKPEQGAETWVDHNGIKRTAVMTQAYGLNGAAPAMCGWPDPDVHYPRPPRDPYEVMAENWGGSAAWYRGLWEPEEWD